MKPNTWSMSGMVVILLAGAMPLCAGTVTYNFGQVSGGTPPSGSPPWIQATFSDVGQPANTVQLTLNAGNLSGSEFVSSWYFNLNPNLDPTSLIFSKSGSTGSFTDPSVSAGANGFKAGPDGKFDVLLDFTTTGGSQFTTGDSITFTITDVSGLTADDFNQLSTACSGGAQYSSAANIGSTTWINPTLTLLVSAETQRVPDGSETIVLLGASLLAIEVVRRKLQIRPSLR